MRNRHADYRLLLKDKVVDFSDKTDYLRIFAEHDGEPYEICDENGTLLDSGIVRFVPMLDRAGINVTNAMIRDAYGKDIVRVSYNDFGEVICRIGKNGKGLWLYFDHDADNYDSRDKYLEDHSEDHVIKKVRKALDEMRSDPSKFDRWFYCYTCIEFCSSLDKWDIEDVVRRWDESHKNEK